MIMLESDSILAAKIINCNCSSQSCFVTEAGDTEH